LSNKESISRNKPKIIVDTSFLLPAMGISTDEEIMKTTNHFYKFEVHYLEVSILEAMCGNLS